MSQLPRILFVDDEERILRSLQMQFRSHYQVFTETSPLRALALLSHQEVDVIVSDQKMPEMSGAEFLAKASEVSPHSLRILLTGYSDLDAAIDALNNGGIFRYLTKPWDRKEMAHTLRQASEVATRQRQASQKPAARGGLNILLLDNDPETHARVSNFCRIGGHNLLEAPNLHEALRQLNDKSIDLLVSDLKLAGQDTAPLLKTLAQAHPRLLSLVVTPFQDTQALLQLINEAQIFRYLPKPIRPGLFEKGLCAAAKQAESWRGQEDEHVVRLPAALKNEDDQHKVNGLMGLLGRLRERLSA